MNKKQIIGIVLFALLIGVIVGFKVLSDHNGGSIVKSTVTVYVATGGGKEDFLADPDVNKILKKKYGIEAVFDSWSNGKTVVLPLIRESINIGNQNIMNSISNGSEVTINTEGVSKYDALFTSDQRFYDYYKLAPNKEAGEADRFSVLDGGLVLYTPIVLYSWKDVANKLTVCYGIKPVVGKFIDDMDQMTKQNVDLAKKALGLKKGDKVIITSGLSNNKKGTVTNFMKVEEI